MFQYSYSWFVIDGHTRTDTDLVLYRFVLYVTRVYPYITTRYHRLTGYHTYI